MNVFFVGSSLGQLWILGLYDVDLGRGVCWGWVFGGFGFVVGGMLVCVESWICCRWVSDCCIGV